VDSAKEVFFSIAEEIRPFGWHHLCYIEAVELEGIDFLSLRH